MNASIRLGKIAGIRVGVHYSLFAVLALVSWSLAQGMLPQRYSGWAPSTYWLTAIFSAVMLFASVLVHELAHSLVARARGLSVEGITLFLFGGVSSIQSDARRPRDEFVISAVGPLASFLLSGLFWIGLLALGSSRSPVAATIWYLALINLLLGAFNLIPAFPLDGGRVLRSIIWGVTGSLSKATTVATVSGRLFGILMMGLGVVEVLNGNTLGGLWVAFIGWFLHGAATSSQQGAAHGGVIRGRRVADVMDTSPLTIGPDASLHEAVYEYFIQRSTRSLPVCEGDKLIGIISVTDIRSVPRWQWSRARVGDMMTPMPLWHVGSDDDLDDALALLGSHSIHQAPVLDNGRLVGLLTRAHIIQYLESRRGLGN